jgi:uncharacterized protein (DUF983 family)
MGKISSAIKMTCPRCGKGDLFEKSNPYSAGKILAMHKNCSNCGMRYERESGFFFGAMYVSYALNIALFVSATVAYYVYFEDKIDWKWYISGYVALTLLLSPIIFRLSRSLWLIMMVGYDPEKRGER